MCGIACMPPYMDLLGALKNNKVKKLQKLANQTDPINSRLTKSSPALNYFAQEVVSLG